MLTVEVVSDETHPLIPTVRELFKEYEKELDLDLCFQGFAEELASLPGKYAPPKGSLFVVHFEGTPIACGALRELEVSTCELKRIYVRPGHRGEGLGRRITLDLMQTGREIGYTTVRLDTLRRLDVARKLYESLGFYEIEPYNYAANHDIVYFERSL